MPSVLSLPLFGIYDLEISYNWVIIEVWKFYGYSWRYGKCLYLCDSYTGWFIPKFIHQVSISQIAPDYFFRKLAEGFTE